MMRHRFELGAATLALSTALAAPAQAATAWTYVDITTTRVSAFGDVYVDTYDGVTKVSKPSFKADMNVRCPAGKPATMALPVYSHTQPVIPFTCTGRQQVVTFPWAAASSEFGWHYQTVTATMSFQADNGTTRQFTDTQVIYVYTSRKSR